VKINKIIYIYKNLRNRSSHFEIRQLF